jgi:hypothetical protein
LSLSLLTAPTVGVIVDRSGKSKPDFGCPFVSLIEMNVETLPANNPPPELARIPAIKPRRRFGRYFFVFVVFAHVDEQFCVSYENIRPSFFSGNCGTKFAKIYWENHRTLVVRGATRAIRAARLLQSLPRTRSTAVSDRGYSGAFHQAPNSKRQMLAAATASTTSAIR